MTSAAPNSSERGALASSLTLKTGKQDDSKSAQAERKAASLKAATTTPRGYRALSANITPWMPDMSKCHVCVVKFTLFNHRHICRKCQEPVCNRCSRARKVLRSYTPPKRVCDICVSKYWAIKARDTNAAAAAAAAAAASATTDSNNFSSDVRKTDSDPRLSLTLSAPSSAAAAGDPCQMYASHTASLSPGTPAASFFGPNTTDMNRGRRRLGSTSVESCLSLGTPSMLPPPTPAGGEGSDAVAPQQEARVLSSGAVLVKEEEEECTPGTFFGGRRESCGGGKGAAAASALVLLEEEDCQSVMAAAGSAVSAAALAAEATTASLMKELGVEATLLSPREAVVSPKEDVQVEAVGVAEQESAPETSLLRRLSEFRGVVESKSGTPEDLRRREVEKREEEKREAARKAVVLGSDDYIWPVVAQAEKKNSPVVHEENTVSEEGVVREGDAGKTEEEVKLEVELEVAEPDIIAPVASVPESVGDDELDEVEGSMDDNFTMPTASAAAAVSAAATAALLPTVLEEPVAKSAVAAAAAVAVLVEANKGGDEAAAVADVVADIVIKDDGADKEKDKVIKDDGGDKEKVVGMKTLACCGVVAFGVGLAVAVFVRSKW